MIIIAQQKLKIWLDDERPMPPDFDTHVRTADEAINALSKGNIGYISFDHDLGIGKSGYDVANWIEKAVVLHNFGRIGWDVHSQNPVGAQRIRVVMTRLDKEWDRLENHASNVEQAQKDYLSE